MTTEDCRVTRVDTYLVGAGPAVRDARGVEDLRRAGLPEVVTQPGGAIAFHRASSPRYRDRADRFRLMRQM